MKVVEEEQRIRVMEGPWSPMGVIREIVESGTQEDPFYVMDLGEVVRRYRQWKELMPRVEPFYAVKCNDDDLMVTTLAALGAGFDCASKAEIHQILALGVEPERVIFANPAKLASHIRYASAAGVDTMTFDSETELLKIKQYYPHAKLVIRIRCDDRSAACPLGVKFGCEPSTEAPRLLKLAAVLGVNVVGVSFHVGSGCRDLDTYSIAIQYCRALFTLGNTYGLDMTLLDIGGGFPGDTDSSILEVSQVINSALERYFPSNNVRVIAEPGRYFAAAAYTLATMVYSKREIPSPDSDSEVHTMYFMNDGVYGSFNCVLYDHRQVEPEPLNPSASKPVPCSVWGPSCDGLDCVLSSASLPALAVGEWLVWRCMGAYTIPVASAFNGFPVPRVRAVIDLDMWATLKELWPLTVSHFSLNQRMTGPQQPPPPPAKIEPCYVECAIK